MTTHNGTGLTNAGIFGLDTSYDQAELIIIPVPWDVTCSHTDGTGTSPAKIKHISSQLDLFHKDIDGFIEDGIHCLAENTEIKKKNTHLRKQAQQIIAAHETGTFSLEDPKLETALANVNKGSALLNESIYKEAEKAIEQNKLIALIGGDHSCSYPLISALIDYIPHFSVLQIDAHMDLRKAYQGFEFSHASIMHNVLKHKDITRLVQVGIRDYSEEEYNAMQTSKGRIKTYFNQDIQEALFQGKTWDAQCKKIINNCTEHVYVSIDVDGLTPSYCPHTGTVVPGGLSFDQVIYLIKKLTESKKRIIGFDIVEANGDVQSIDIRTAAQLCFHVGAYAWKSHQ